MTLGTCERAPAEASTIIIVSLRHAAYVSLHFWRFGIMTAVSSRGLSQAQGRNYLHSVMVCIVASASPSVGLFTEHPIFLHVLGQCLHRHAFLSIHIEHDVNLRGLHIDCNLLMRSLPLSVLVIIVSTVAFGDEFFA